MLNSYSGRGIYWRTVFISLSASNCVTFIRGRCLLEGGVFLSWVTIVYYNIQREIFIHHNLYLNLLLINIIAGFIFAVFSFHSSGG